MVSGDKHLFVLHGKHGLDVMTPEELKALLAGVER